MKFGVVMYTGIDPRVLVDVARETEAAGWDGFFVWDAFLSDNAWMLLATIAMATERVRLGTMLTAPSRRRPWQLASGVATLDRLSNGRAILSLGLGAAEDLGFAGVGEATDRKTRAELLDESIDILSALWSGQVVDYQGKHYHVRKVRLNPPPVQTPRIPIWVVGAWHRLRSMQRGLRCDGVIPTTMTPEGIHLPPTPDDIRAINAYMEAGRTLTTPFDVVIEGDTPGNDMAQASTAVRPFAECGATWWLESAAVHHRHGGLAKVRARIRQGPPRPA